MSSGLSRRLAPTIWAARGDALQYSTHLPKSLPPPTYTDRISRSCASASGGTGRCAVLANTLRSSLCMVTSRTSFDPFILFQRCACSR